MNESKNTKKALHASLVSLFLCIVMLIGTTFAWFTDSASTGVNKIQAGNLDVKLNYKDGDTWKDAEGVKLFDYDKWEPGYMEVQGLQVENAGNLALKWKAAINSTKELSELADVIDVYVKAGADYKYKKPETRDEVTSSWKNVGTLRDFVNGVETTTSGSLKANETADLGLALVMSTEAGNKYQGMDLGGDITVTILATQDTVENDSFDNTYDENAEILVAKTASGLQDAINAIKESGTVILGNDIVLDKQVKIGKGQTLTLDLNRYKTTNTEDLYSNKGGVDVWSQFAVDGGNLTINGDGAVMAKPNDTYAIDVQHGGNLTINGGTFAGNIHAVYVYEGSLTINGGTFYIQQHDWYKDDPYGYTINAYDSNYKSGKAKITIKGGTFKNFNPAANTAETEEVGKTNFVPEGYHVTQKIVGEDIWYTVVKD